MREHSGKAARAVVAYVAVIALIAGIWTAVLTWRWGAPQWADGLVFLLLHAIAHRLSARDVPVARPVSAGKRAPSKAPALTGGFVVLLVAAFTVSPPTAAVVGLLTQVVPPARRGPLRNLFNSAQCSIYAATASGAFFLLRGDTVLSNIAAACLATVAAVTINHVLVAGVVSIERGMRLLEGCRKLLWPAPASVGFATLALLISTLYRDAGPAAVFFMLTPILVLRRARAAKLELDDAHERTLRAFVRAMELKDPYTQRHSERVAEIVVEIHRRLGASDAVLQRRYYGALLHDLGKVAIPGRILTKPGALTAWEYEAVKRHPAAGAEVMSEIEWLADLRDEVLYHHERLDGTGYPHGLAGDAIPLTARVLAVADTFEALTSDRPYRRALSVRAALEVIRREGAGCLDADAVSALNALVADGVHEALTPAARLPLPGAPATGRSVPRAAEA